jgi:hypothetical protein
MIYSLQKPPAIAYIWPTNVELFSKGQRTTKNGKVIYRILQVSPPSCYRSLETSYELLLTSQKIPQRMKATPKTLSQPILS